MNVLMMSKNRMEKTKKLLHLFYTAKARWPYLSIDRDLVFDQLNDLKRFGHFIPLPKLTPEGDRVLLCHLNKFTTDDIPPTEFILKCCVTLLEVSLKVDRFRRIILIMDLQNMNSAVASLTVSIAAKAPTLLAAKNVPARVGNIYILNLHPVFQWLVNFTKSLLETKITEKFVIWNKEPEYLSEEIPPYILPCEFGGTEKPCEDLNDEFLEYVKQFRDYAASLVGIKADLSKIPDNYKYNKKNEVEFGIDGTFRNLLIE